MRRQFMLGTLFSAALAVAASAQSASQSPTEQQDKTANRNDAAQTVMLSGCLKSADDSSTTAASPTANPDAATRPAAGGRYILTDAAPSTGDMASTTPSPDNPATPPSNPTGTTGSAGKSYRLTGSTSDFSSLVGKRVEVKGTLQNRSGSGAGAAGGNANSYPSNPAGGAAQSSARTGSDTNMPAFRVTSVREVPGTCPSEGK